MTIQPPSNPRRILIVKPSSLGDVVHTLPAVALLKQRWPAAHLQWVVNPEWAPLLAGNPHVDEIVEFPRREFRGMAGLLRFSRWSRKLLAKHRSDLVIDFQGLFRSAVISRLARLSGGQIRGLSDAREGAGWFYDQATDVTGHAHAVNRYLAAVKALDIPVVGPLEWRLPKGTLPADLPSELMERGFIVLHPFSRGGGKSMTGEDAAEFCRQVAPCHVIIAGRSDEAVPAVDNAFNLLNRTSLLELIWLLRQARFVVSVDSGPMHIAAALQKPLLSIHTWSDPAKVGPYSDSAWIWKDGRVMTMKSWKSDPASGEQVPLEKLGSWVAGWL